MSQEQRQPTIEKPKRQILKNILQLLFSLLVLGCAVALASHYMQSTPKAKPRTRTSKPPLVTIAQIQPQNVEYEFDAMGTVTSSRQIGITPRVSGEIIAISPEMSPGGRAKSGDELFKIDPTDYEISVLQLQSDVAKAKSDLELEMGNQRIAQKEFELLGQAVSKTEENLMLRKPQLGIAKASVAAAEANLAKAKLDLKRTSVVAPFNGIIISENVDLGSRVHSNSPTGQLVGTDQFRIKVSLPVEQLKWLDIPGSYGKEGSPARVYQQDRNQMESFREARVIGLAADLESEGRMAVLYMAVDDPLCLKPDNREKEKLFLGSFVQVRFTGKKLQEVYTIHRDHLHDGDTIWLLGDDDNLRIQEIEIVARSKTHVYTREQLGENPLLITSQISSPTDGTPLKRPGKKKKGGLKGARQ